MSSLKLTGRVIGTLLVVQLALGLIVPYIILLPLTTTPSGFLETAAGMAAQIRLNVFLLFVGTAVSVWISIALWPIVREQNRKLGLLLLILGASNFVLQMLENNQWLSMLSVSQVYTTSAAKYTEIFQVVGMTMIRSGFKWAHYSHILVVVGWLFTFYCVLFSAGMAPRVLTIFGMITSVLHFIGITLPAFAGYNMPYPELFGMPLALATLAIATWFIAKGLPHPNATAIIN